MSPTTKTADKAPKTPAKKTVKETMEEAALKAVQAPMQAILLDQVFKATPGLDPSKVVASTAVVKDPKVKAIEDAFKSMKMNHDNDKEQIKTLFEAMMGVTLDIDNKTAKDLVTPFMLVVPITNPNSHSYTLGGVCMFKSRGGSHALEVKKGKAVVGNELPTGSLGDDKTLRYATKVEAEEFVGKLVSSFENIQALRSWMGGTLDSLLDK